MWEGRLAPHSPNAAPRVTRGQRRDPAPTLTHPSRTAGAALGVPAVPRGAPDRGGRPLEGEAETAGGGREGGDGHATLRDETPDGRGEGTEGGAEAGGGEGTERGGGLVTGRGAGSEAEESWGAPRGALWGEGPLAELLQCGVCLAPLSSARLLPCAHSFCSPCLHSHVLLNSSASRSRKVRQRSFPCPSCRLPTPLPPSGVSGLPPDFRLTRATDVIAQLMTSPPRLCDICRLRSGARLEPAACFCPDCLKHFCSACAARHDVSDVLRGHLTVTLPPMTSLPQSPDPPACPRHPLQHAPFTCGTCCQAVCLLCVLEDCSTHAVTSPSLSDVRGGESGGLRQSLARLDWQMQQMQERMFQLTCLEGALTSSYDSARCHIRRHTRSLVACLRGKGRQLSARVEALYTARRDALYREREELRGEMQRLEARQGQITALLRTACLPELRGSLSHLLEDAEDGRDREAVNIESRASISQRGASTQRENWNPDSRLTATTGGEAGEICTQKTYPGIIITTTPQNHDSSTPHSSLIASPNNNGDLTAGCSVIHAPLPEKFEQDASFVQFIPGSLADFGKLEPITLTTDISDLPTVESSLLRGENHYQLPRTQNEDRGQNTQGSSAFPHDARSLSPPLQSTSHTQEACSSKTERSSRYVNQLQAEPGDPHVVKVKGEGGYTQAAGTSQDFSPRRPQLPGSPLYPSDHFPEGGMNRESELVPKQGVQVSCRGRAIKNLGFHQATLIAQQVTPLNHSTSTLVAPQRESSVDAGGRLTRSRSLSALRQFQELNHSELGVSPLPHLGQTRQRTSSHSTSQANWMAHQHDLSQTATTALFIGMRRERGDSSQRPHLSIETPNHLKYNSTSSTSGRQANPQTSRHYQVRLPPAQHHGFSRSESNPEVHGPQRRSGQQQANGADPAPVTTLPRQVTGAAGLGGLKAHLLCRVGGQGRDPGCLSRPYSLCFTEDNLLAVADNGNGCIRLLDTAGNCRGLLAEEGFAPRGVASLPGGKLLVADEGRRRALVFSQAAPRQAHHLPLPATAFPFGVAASVAGLTAWSDLVFARVTLLSTSDPRGPGLQCQGSRLDSPGHLALDESRVFVSDSNQHRIKVFSQQSGHFLFEFGGQGGLPGQLCYPKAVSLDSQGRVWVADSGNSRVAVYDKSGHYLATPLSRTHGLDRPSGLALSPTGLLAVSLPDQDTVLVFQLQADS